MLLFSHGTDSCFELKIACTYSSRVRKKSLQENEENLLLVPDRTKQRNEHLHAFLSFPIHCLGIHSPQHPDKPALPRNPNIIMRLKPKQCLKTNDDMYGHLQIL
jgi:hypothetical protein